MHTMGTVLVLHSFAAPSAGVATDSGGHTRTHEHVDRRAEQEVAALSTSRAVSDVPADLAAAVPGKAAHENFPVALPFLPAVVRRDLMAVYGFARLVDDLGDEAPGDAATRGALLDAVDADLDLLYVGARPSHPLVARLAPTVEAHALPAEPFRRLVQANRVDQQVSRYPTYDDLLGYCELSANPVGHLVLGIFDASTLERRRLSDDVCTALQLAEHWQDIAEDLARGRVYLPQADLATFGVAEADLALAPASEDLRRLMAFEVRRARELLDRGTPLVATLSGLARVAVAGFVAGGRATLTSIAAADYDVVSAVRRPGRRRTARELVRLLTARGRAA